MLSTVPPISKHRRRVEKVKAWRKLRPVLLPRPASSSRRKPLIYHQLPSHLIALLQEFLRSPLWKSVVGRYFERNGSVYRVMSLTDSERYARVQRVPTVREEELSSTTFYVRVDTEWLQKPENAFHRLPEKHPSYRVVRIDSANQLWIDDATHYLIADDALYDMRMVSSIRGWVLDGQPEHQYYPSLVFQS